MNFTLRKGIGYRGKRGSRSYIARITGTCRTYGFAREFEETEPTNHSEMSTALRKGRGQWTETADVGCGAYEIQDQGDRYYYLVWCREDRLVRMRTDAERVHAIARLLDNGMEFEEARLATKPPSAEGGA